VEGVCPYTPPRIYPIKTMEQERKLTICIFFLPIPKKMPRQTLVTKYFSSPKQEKEPPRDSAPLHSTRKEINHSTRERER
jgi:hypothetical protein